MPFNKAPYPFEDVSQLRAEVIAASLTETGAAFFDKLRIEHLGSFRRRYRPDAEPVTRDVTGEITGMRLHRDSIYDRLPEGLFHQPKRGTENSDSLLLMLGEHRRHKEDEAQARRFFQPIEQEFFRYSTAVEEAERQGLRSLQRGTMTSLFSLLWDMPDGLPEAAVPTLVNLMPWVAYIKGDAINCARVLSMLLIKPVCVTELVIDNHNTETAGLELGAVALGNNSITGAGFEEPVLCWEFTIGDVSGNQVLAFADEEGVYNRLLRHFVHTFIPLEVDAVFSYEIALSDDEEAEKVLGFSFIL